MQVGEAVQRILVQHWRLITLLILLGGAVGLAVGLRSPQLYAASARVSLASTDPKDAAESQALADSGRAIVTSPTHVARALAAIGGTRDAKMVAEQHVALDAMGTSGVARVTVTDPNPYVAARLANALAQDLVITRGEMAHGSTQSPADQLASVQAEILQIDTQIASLDKQLATAQPIDVPALAAILSQLTSERAGLVQETLVLQGQQGPYASIIEAAAPPDRPQTPRWPALAGLGGVLGLVVGLVAAAAIETLRPTVVGARAVAGALGAPLLGEVPTSGHPRSTALGRIWRRLALVMRSTGVGSVEVVGAPKAELEEFAAELGRHSDAALGNGAGVRVPTPSANGVAARGGVVVVAGNRVRLGDLESVAELVSLAGKPLLGVVTVHNVRQARGRVRDVEEDAR